MHTIPRTAHGYSLGTHSAAFTLNPKIPDPALLCVYTYSQLGNRSHRCKKSVCMRLPYQSMACWISKRSKRGTTLRGKGLSQFCQATQRRHNEDPVSITNATSGAAFCSELDVSIQRLFWRVRGPLVSES